MTTAEASIWRAHIIATLNLPTKAIEGQGEKGDIDGDRGGNREYT